jgi:hypothetical protein
MQNTFTLPHGRQPARRAWLAGLIASLLTAHFAGAQSGTNLVVQAFDFTNPTDAAGWAPTHDLAPLSLTSTGLLARITGADPYMAGPPRDYPVTTPLWLRLKLLSDAGGSCQIFYFSNSATEANSVRFTVPAGAWTEGRVPVPSFGPGYRIRIDPPGTNGKATLAFLRAETRSEFPEFDFRTVPDVTSWSPAHDISSLTPTTNGLVVQISGGDPYLTGPPRDYPPGKLLWLHLRLKSDQGGIGQVFYYTNSPTEANSVKFFVPVGDWYEAQVSMPALGPAWQLRIDPPGSGGTCLLDRLWFEERTLLQAPAWPKPVLPVMGPDALTLQSGDLTLTHDAHALGAFELTVAGQAMAVGHAKPMIGYLVGRVQRWFDLGNSPTNPANVSLAGGALRVLSQARDPDGALWTVECLFAPTNSGAILVESRVAVNQDRQVVYLPLLTLLPGLGSFGTNKNQGLFCGLEYLENEPSSSQADIIGPESQRQVPDMLKVTFPLMAVAAQDRYLGLIWETDANLSAVFDSPDRLFGSGGHLMGVIFPGSDGQNRVEGDLILYRPALVHSNEPVVLRAVITGGRGQSVVPAVQQYFTLCGLPPLPAPVPAAADYFNLASHSWLDSQIRTNGLFRSAYWPGFNPQPAADASVWMRWLAGKTSDPDLQTRLVGTAGLAIQQVPGEQNFNNYQIAHVQYPLPALFYNAALADADSALANARGLLGRFQPDGTVLYQPTPGGTDYGKTHYAPDANGLTATFVQSLLENAAFSGDRGLLDKGLHYLRALDKFRNTVPRGAQTWEVPLHTPDILASAKLLRCYTLGYELTGDPDFLDQARYWAWTGVPFIYLAPPTGGAVGMYATIPVFGASDWVASWLGVPVQWCGLVYADALNRFLKYDSAGPWRQLADGIAASGIQQSWPLDDTERLGLLPDSYQLRPQIRSGPAINPGTVQSAAVRYYQQPAVYDFHAFPWHGVLVHAAGELGAITENSDGLGFTVTNWSSSPASLMVNGFTNQPRVRLDGQEIQLVFPHQYQASTGRLVLRLQGTVRIEIVSPAVPRLEIKRSATNASVDVSWPAPASNFVLESSAILTSPDLWQPSSAEVRQEGGNLTATEGATDSARVYRLRKGP